MRTERLTDERREVLIERARKALVKARTRQGRAKMWATMKRLINQRSPAQVARMERERGLRQ